MRNLETIAIPVRYSDKEGLYKWVAVRTGVRKKIKIKNNRHFRRKNKQTIKNWYYYYEL